MTSLRKKKYSLVAICALVGISPQAYHKRLKSAKKKQGIYDIAEKKVKENRHYKSRSGLRTIYHKEQLHNLMGINQFEKQMSIRGHALRPYKKYIKTTDSRGHHNKFENIVSGMQVNVENQVIVGDMTFYQNETGLYYIFQFVDYYTLEVKGLVGSDNAKGINADKCLLQVLDYNGKYKYSFKMILHTDAGSQYRSNKFIGITNNAQIKPSHARNCLENGLSERVNGIIKNEYLNDYEIKNVGQLNKALKKIKYQINEVWPSPILGYKTPKEFAKEQREKELDQRMARTIKVVEKKGFIRHFQQEKFIPLNQKTGGQENNPPANFSSW